jgi:hypothetical protein
MVLKRPEPASEIQFHWFAGIEISLEGWIEDFHAQISGSGCSWSNGYLSSVRLGKL